MFDGDGTGWLSGAVDISTGSAWAAHTGPLLGFPYAASADAANDIWVVGASINGAFTFTTFTANSEAATREIPCTCSERGADQNNRLRRITAVSPNDIWAFGAYLAAGGSKNAMTLVL